MKKSLSDIWRDAYNGASAEKKHSIEKLVAAVWAVVAGRAGFIMFDQECDLAEGEDESEYELFQIRVDDFGNAKRYYVDGSNRVEELFLDDIYDDLIVGNAAELLEDYGLEGLFVED